MALAMAAAALLLVSVAGAAVPEFLTKSPEDGVPGADAGQMTFSWGVAASPKLPGDVYVVDSENARIAEFTAWGEFVRAWGWGVKDGEAEFEVCTKEAPGCQKGLEGGGAGQFDDPEAIAVDSSGDVYVIEAENHRVQKFDSEGNFILMFGREVNETTKVDVCTKADEEGGDICRAGVAGSGLGQFNLGFAGYANRITTSQVDGSVFVGEGDRIQVFNQNGGFKEEIKGECLAGKTVLALTSDAAGNLYAAFVGGAEVRKLKASGPTAECLPPGFKAESPPTALALDPVGHLYTVVLGGGEPPRVLEFDPSGKCLNCGSEGEGGKSGFDRSPESTPRGVAVSAVCGPVDIYVTDFRSQAPSQSFFKVFGEPPNPMLCPPPSAAPEITSQYALSVDTTSAKLQAEINPRFWPDTTFYLQYGTSPCFKGGCTATPDPPGALLTSKTTKAQLKTSSLLLEGLTPGTTYHYRFVAQSSGGGPIVGLSGKSGAEAEGTFTTFVKPVPESCPANEAFRDGAAALLPDCRAYELVSPLDKNNADIAVLLEATELRPASLDQSSTDGEKLAYGSAASFGDAPSAPYTSQYIATRGATEWKSHAISPHREGLNLLSGSTFDTELKALSPDLCEAWMRTVAEPLLSPAAIAGFPNLYRRSDEECGGPSFEALSTVQPGINPLGSIPLELQGLSIDGETAIYLLNDSLAGTEAPPEPPGCLADEFGSGCRLRVYLQEPGEGTPHYVCILPDGTPLLGSCSAGTNGGDSGRFRNSNYQGAISADGTRVFWTAAGTGNLGSIYVRENPAEPQSGLDGEGNCTEAELACTIGVSKKAEEFTGTKESRFWAAAADGTAAIFTTSKGSLSDLYEFDVESKTTTLIAHEVPGVLGVSEDASYVYFASEEVLSEANPQGTAPTESKPNLYRYHEGSFAFVGTLADIDAETTIYPSSISPRPIKHPARVSPDGLHAAFMSTASLTGNDNADAKSGNPDAEVYLYDASANGGEGKLLCASCNPSGARPTGEDLNEGAQEFWIAAQIPVFENNLYAARVLSEDGNRLYFEAVDALTPRDTNGAIDIYQWEAAGTGGCDKEDPGYADLNEGCIDLISSGKSPSDAKFTDASPDGEDVFFTTLASLQPHDYGLGDIYDARAGGGLPPPPVPPPGCEGDSCQSPAAAPNDPTAASASFRGAGDPKPATTKPKPRCAKGKRQVRRGGKARCVKKQAKRKRAGAKRGAKR